MSRQLRFRLPHLPPPSSSVRKMWASQKSSTASNIPIKLAPDITSDQLHSFAPFRNWLSTLEHSLNQQSRYRLRNITINSVAHFGSRIGFLHLTADVSDDDGTDRLPASVFLRGGSVAILLILEPEDRPDEKWVVLAVQPRVPAGVLEMVELPAGMMDDEGFAGSAAREIREECGIEIKKEELQDLTEMALGKLVGACKEQMVAGVYPSPGGSDEIVKVFCYKHKVEGGRLDEWRGKLTGLRDEGEKITLKIVRLEDLWKETTDAKALAAVALYEGLRKEGRI